MKNKSPCPKPIIHPANTANADEFAALCKALGHPARVRILQILIKMDRCICGQIVDVMPLAQSTVSQHLKILRESGLVQGEVEGPRSCYCVDKEVLGRFQNMAGALLEEHDE